MFNLRRSKLLLENKVLIYKIVLNPIWIYVVQLQLRDAHKIVQQSILQRFQAKLLYVPGVNWTNWAIHEDFRIGFVQEEIYQLSSLLSLIHIYG